MREAELLEHVAVLTVERDSYRELAHVAVTDLARVTAQLNSARFTISVFRWREQRAA